MAILITSGISIGALSKVIGRNKRVKYFETLFPHSDEIRRLFHSSKPIASTFLMQLKNNNGFRNGTRQLVRTYSTLNVKACRSLLKSSFIYLNDQRSRLIGNKPSAKDFKPTHIIIGAGTAGCVLANRLTENQNNHVLLVEAGCSDDWWRWNIHMPSSSLYNMCTNKYNYYYHTLPQTNMDDRVMYCPGGKVWGGSSTLNAMIYTRGHAKDYDRWANVEGADGWSYADCLPYFKKSESFDRGGDLYRGDQGPLKVHRFDGYQNPLYAAFIDAGIQAGFTSTQDINGYKQEGFGYMDATIYRGKRWSAAQAYLHPILNRPNFYYETRSMVTKILMHKQRAVGIEIKRFMNNNAVHGLMDFRDHVYALDKIILCGGAINSPSLLMLSGIGHELVLKGACVTLHQHLPGVGQNLQDHLEIYVKQKCSKPITMFDKSDWKSNPFKMTAIGLKWFLTGGGLGSTSHYETGGFVRTDDEDHHPNVQFRFLPSTIEDHGRSPPKCHSFQINVGSMRPTSRGFIKIGSADPLQEPAINFNYLSTEYDRKEMRDCLRLSRRVFTQKSFENFRAGEISPQGFVQPPNDDDESGLDAWARAHAYSAYDPCGTCKMGPASDPTSVVDPHTMIVHGTDNLCVVDASIMPSLISGNLNGPVIMIAEKAADHLQKKPCLPSSTVSVWSHKAEENVCINFNEDNLKKQATFCN